MLTARNHSLFPAVMRSVHYDEMRSVSVMRSLHRTHQGQSVWIRLRRIKNKEEKTDTGQCIAMPADIWGLM